jgi:hypothetical protein
MPQLALLKQSTGSSVVFLGGSSCNELLQQFSPQQRGILKMDSLKDSSALKTPLSEFYRSWTGVTENVESTGFDMCMGTGSREKISKNSEIWANVPLLRTCARL